MTLVDVAILVVLLAFLLKGLLRGVLKEVCSLTGYVAGAFVAFRYHAPLAERAMESFAVPSKVAVIVTFLALFVGTLVFFSVLGIVLSRFLKLIFLGGLNRVAGGLFGLVQGGILLALILFALSLGPLPPFFQQPMEASHLAPPFVQLGEAIFQESLRLFTESA